MSILIRRFRSWWQPPRRAGDRIEHRQVTFLELFYDLVYVALVASGGPGSTAASIMTSMATTTSARVYSLFCR